MTRTSVKLATSVTLLILIHEDCWICIPSTMAYAWVSHLYHHRFHQRFPSLLQCIRRKYLISRTSVVFNIASRVSIISFRTSLGRLVTVHEWLSLVSRLVRLTDCQRWNSYRRGKTPSMGMFGVGEMPRRASEKPH